MSSNLRHILIFIFFLCSANVFGQFLDPKKCLLVESLEPHEKRLIFCQLLTYTSKEIFQIRKVTLIDKEYDYSYKKLTEETEAKPLSTDTIPAYLIEGI